MKARTFASVAVMTALGLLAPIQAHAFGLGKIELSSALNEPFQAEIAVSALRVDDEGPLQVQLASNAEFEKAGLKRSFLLTQLNFEVVEKDGETKIKISSTQAVKEPFIDFLLTATTGNGRLIREYTVLLDPPKNVFVKPVQTKQQTRTPTAKKKSAPQKSTYKYPDPQMPAAAPSYSSATSYGPVGRSETLSAIARDTKPSSAISLNQMMMALLNANPESFSNRNINGLKAGYTLDIPSEDEIKALSKGQAFAAVKEQHDLWKNRNRVVAETTEPAMQENSTLEASEGETNAQVSDTTESSEAETDSARLKLVVPHDESATDMDELAISGNKELLNLSEQLTLAQETIESQTQENIDIKSRMDLMEEQLQTLRRLITLKDADLARMQSNLDAGSNETEITEADSTEAMIAEADSTEAMMAEVDSIEEMMAEADSVEAMMAEADSVEAVMNEVDSIESVQNEAGQSEVEAYFASLESGEPFTQENEASDDAMATEQMDHSEELADELTDNDATAKLPLEVAEDYLKSTITKVKSFYTEHKQQSLIAGLLAALLALILLVIRNRRSKQEVSWEEASASNTTVAVESSNENVVDDANVSQEPEVSTAKTDEDMIKEAYASIEETEDDADSQVDTISELEQEELNIPEEIDSNIEELDLTEPEPEVEAEEPITLGTEPDVLDVEDTAETDLEFNTDELSLDIETDTIDESVEEDKSLEDELLDFNLDSDGDSSKEENEPLELDELVTEEADSDTLDFDTPLSVDAASEEANANLDDEPLSLDIDKNLLDDISLDDSPVSLELPEDESIDIPTLNIEDEDMLPEDADLTEGSTIPTEEPALEENDVEFDLGDFDEIDEAETKLDLAGAYMDMGDPEGARNILEEVLIDGNEEQKSRAQSLLNDLS